MNFQTFWNQLSKDTSSGKEFFTLSRKKSFVATHHNETIVIKPNKTKYERPLNRNEFLKVWTKASKLSVGQCFIPKNYHDDTFHSSYIVTLMKFIVKDNDVSV